MFTPKILPNFYGEAFHAELASPWRNKILVREWWHGWGYTNGITAFCQQKGKMAAPRASSSSTNDEKTHHKVLNNPNYRVLYAHYFCEARFDTTFHHHTLEYFQKSLQRWLRLKGEFQDVADNY